MDVNLIIKIVTVFVTLILGIISKKSKIINSKKIPIQNLIIGIISFVVDYLITKDFNASLIFSGLLAGGTYDLAKNIFLIFNIKSDIPKELDEEILESEEIENE